MMEDQRGPLLDRTQEHLVSSDAAIIQVRRRLLGAARALAEGKEPEAPWHPEAYAYHSASIVVDPDTRSVGLRGGSPTAGARVGPPRLGCLPVSPHQWQNV